MITVGMDEHAKYALVAVCLVVVAIVINSGYLSPAAPGEEAKAPPANVEYMYTCDMEQVFNFDQGYQGTVFHVNSLKIAGQQMRSDLTVADPTTGQPIKVIGVGADMYWGGGYTDPLQFSTLVSTDNKNQIVGLLQTSMSNTDMEVSFTVYDYDPVAGRYYKAFHTDDKKLNAQVLRAGGELNLFVDDADPVTMDPITWMFAVGAVPLTEYQEQEYIHVASSASATEPKQFGRA